VSVAETVSFECSHCSWAYTATPELAEQQAEIHGLIHPGGPRQAGRQAGRQDEPVRDVSAAELTRTRICEFPGCPEDADVGNWCFYHARHAAPEAPPLPAEPTPVPKPESNGGAAVRSRTNPWTRDQAIEALKAYHEQHGSAPGWAQLKAKNGLPSYPTLQKLFGGLPQAHVAAGIENGQPQRPPRAARKPDPPAKPVEEAVPAERETDMPSTTANGSLVALAQAVEDARRDVAAAEADLARTTDALLEAIHA
jgi:hypothetical protein